MLLISLCVFTATVLRAYCIHVTFHVFKVYVGCPIAVTGRKWRVCKKIILYFTIGALFVCDSSYIYFITYMFFVRYRYNLQLLYFRHDNPYGFLPAWNILILWLLLGLLSIWIISGLKYWNNWDGETQGKRSSLILKYRNEHNNFGF